MKYQQARQIAVIKRIVGWVIFIPCLLSTIVSLLNFLAQYNKTNQGISAVLLDFVHVLVNAVRVNTSFLDLFWFASPLPSWGAGVTLGNILFVLIYWLIFVGAAFQASGVRISQQIRRLREGIEDRIILQQAQETVTPDRNELEQHIELPGHSVFRQYITLYISPLVIAIIGYLLGHLAGILN
jgi:hypothetical protein